MSDGSSSSRSTKRSKSRKTTRMQFNTKNEANAILAILENRVRNMSEETSRMHNLEKNLTRLNKSIEDNTEKMKERVRGAEDEMRGRLGLDPELRWSEVRKMKWGSEMDNETSLSNTKSDHSGSTTSRSDASTEASSVDRSEPRTSRSSMKARKGKKPAKTKAPKKPNPALTRYDEALKHLEAASAELKAIAVSAIREDDELNKHGSAVRDLAEKLKITRDQLDN